jgi:hypothetical protein
MAGRNTISCAGRSADLCVFGSAPSPSGHVHGGTGTVGNTTSPPFDPNCYVFAASAPSHGSPGADLPQCDACTSAWVQWALFVGCVFAANVLALGVMKRGSATLMCVRRRARAVALSSRALAGRYLCTAAVLPLVCVLAAVPEVMGAGAEQPLTWTAVVSCLLVLIGFALWARHESTAVELASGGRPARARARCCGRAMNLTRARPTGPNSGAYLPQRFSGSINLRVPLTPEGDDGLSLKRALYQKLGVSSPGPGRAG